MTYSCYFTHDDCEMVQVDNDGEVMLFSSGMHLLLQTVHIDVPKCGALISDSLAHNITSRMI